MQIEIQRCNRKSVVITVNSKAEVIIKAPYNTTNAEIQEILQKRAKWIKDHVDKVKKEIAMNIVTNILGLGNKLSKQEPIFLRNIFMNLIYMFDSKFLNLDFDKWLNQLSIMQYDIYLVTQRQSRKYV